MKFYAHTAEDAQGNRLPEQKWQPLSEHLRNVADLAKKFATPLGLAAEAELAGSFHYFHKHSERFQARRRENSINDINHLRKKKADRVLLRSAIPESGQSRQLNVSIRALSGEHIQLSQTGTNSAIDKPPNQCIIAIELTAIKGVNDEQIVEMVVMHMRECSLPMKSWFAGVCAGPRRHPWDEQELLFPTKAWIVVPAETAERAQRIAEQLFRSGWSKSPTHTDSASAKYVFAYALNQESLN